MKTLAFHSTNSSNSHAGSAAGKYPDVGQQLKTHRHQQLLPAADLGRPVFETAPLETLRKAEEYLDWLEANGCEDMELVVEEGKGFVIRC